MNSIQGFSYSQEIIGNFENDNIKIENQHYQNLETNQWIYNGPLVFLENKCMDLKPQKIKYVLNFFSNSNFSFTTWEDLSAQLSLQVFQLTNKMKFSPNLPTVPFKKKIPHIMCEGVSNNKHPWFFPEDYLCIAHAISRKKSLSWGKLTIRSSQQKTFLTWRWDPSQHTIEI